MATIAWLLLHERDLKDTLKDIPTRLAKADERGDAAAVDHLCDLDQRIRLQLEDVKAQLAEKREAGWAGVDDYC